MNLLALGFVSTVALIGLVFLIAAMYRWPVVAGVIAAGTVLVAWEVPVIPPVASVLGSNVYLQDIVSITFLVVTVIRLVRTKWSLRPVMLLWLCLGVSLALSLSAGLVTFSLGSAVNEFRSFIYPFAAFSWAMGVDWEGPASRKMLQNGGLILGWGLCIIALFHFSLYGFGSTSTFVDLSTGNEQTTRPLISSQALVLLLCAFFVIDRWRKSKDFLAGASSAVFILVLILSQQRTVWACALAGGLFYLLAMKDSPKAIAVAAVSGGAGFLAMVSASAIDPGLLARLVGAASDTGTYDARINGWTVLTDALFESGPLSVAFGAPMGSGFGRYEGARWVEYAPHNWYVTVFLRVGLIGLLFLLAFLLRGLWVARYREASPLPFVILGTICVYGWTYSWPWFLCFFWGYACSGLARTGNPRGSFSSDTRQFSHTFDRKYQ